MKISDLCCISSFSSQEDGGGPDSSWSVLSQDFPESTASLDRPHSVCGHVSGYQYIHILQWLLQQTRGHVSRQGLCIEWTKCNSTTPEQNGRGGNLSADHITILGLSWIHDPVSRGSEFGSLNGWFCFEQSEI